MKTFFFLFRYLKSLSVLYCLAACLIPYVTHAQQQDYPVRATYDGMLFQHKTDTIAIQNLMKQGNALVYQQPDSAIIIYNKVIALCRLTRYDVGITRALINIGACHVVKNDYYEAISFFKKALPFSPATGYNQQMEYINFYNNISVPYFHLGKSDSALAYLLKGLDMAVKMKDTLRMIHFYANISGVWTQNDLSKSAQYAQKAINLALHKKDSSSLPQLYGIMASNSAGNAEKSLDYMHKALMTVRSEQQKVGILSKVGQIYLSNGFPDSAVYYLTQALEAREHNSLDVYSNLGMAYHLLKQNEKALYYMEKALEIAAASGVRNQNLTTTWYNTAEILSSLGRYKEAAAYLKAYADLRDSLLSADRNEALGLLDVKYRTAEKDKAIMAGQLQLANAQQMVTRRNIWIGSIVIGFLFIVIIGFVYFRNLRHKQRNQQNKLLLFQQKKEIELLKAGMNGEEKERTRIAYELHDGIGGMLAAIKMNFGAVQERYANLYGLAELNPLMQMMEDATDEVRKTAHNLMPGILLKHSLSEALRIYCSNINATGKLNISLRLHGELDKLPKDFELMLYRTIQELIQNIIKHAGASRAVVELEHRNNQVQILVEDNGAGFDAEKDKGGFGLQNLRFRVQALQGYISIESAKDCGTTIIITFDDEQVKTAFAL